MSAWATVRYWRCAGSQSRSPAYAQSTASHSTFPGEIHALVGENGAGKSTLMKVLGGVYPYGSYDGEILIDGEERSFHRVRDAEEAGIAIIFQELSIIKDLNIGENIFLGREPRRFGIINWEELYSRAHKLLDDLHLPLDPRTPIGELGIGQQQLVEIAKALSQQARILVLDEPTAALTDRSRNAVSNSRQVAQAGRWHDLHLAQARRGVSYLGPNHRASRRPRGRNRTC